MSQDPLYATARCLTLSAFVAAAVVGCTAKNDARAADAGTTNIGTATPGAPNATPAAPASGDSASGAVVTHSAPPTVQDRRVAVPNTGHTADTNHSGMAVTNRAAPRDSH